MDVSTKEEAKALLGYSQVPYYVVVGKDGHVIGHGDSKRIDINSLVISAKNQTISSPSHGPVLSTDAMSFDEDF